MAAGRTVLDGLAAKLVAKRRLDIPGFGQFKAQDFKAYDGRNPRTGEPIEVPAKRVPMFKFDRALQLRIDEGSRDPLPLTGADPELAAAVEEVVAAAQDCALGAAFGLLGRLYVRAHDAREGRNPDTGEPIVVAARRVPIMKMSRRVVRGVNRQPVRELAGVADLLARSAEPRELVAALSGGGARRRRVVEHPDMIAVLAHLEQVAPTIADIDVLLADLLCTDGSWRRGVGPSECNFESRAHVVF